VKVRVDADRCQGHGRCAALAPEVYRLDELGFAVGGTTEVEPGCEEQARLGAQSCPERAIQVVSESG
jgi:ferredoxin